MLSSMLTRLGYAVETAANGLRGLEMLAGKVFDVVLCDIRMPEMDGMEFLRRVSEEGISTTIIMMSAFGTVETALEAMRRGAYDYISKPFKADEIELTLRKAEEREKLKRDNQELRDRMAALEGECVSVGWWRAARSCRMCLFWRPSGAAPDHGADHR
jgi:two-component system response regulator AtoC